MKAIIRDKDLQGTSAAISAREYAMIKKERSRLVAGEYIFNFDPEDLLDLKKIKLHPMRNMAIVANMNGAPRMAPTPISSAELAPPVIHTV
jgi:hypothetical protein